MLLFLFNSVSLGVGLAMDAFSLSLVNGMNEPQMPARKMILIAGVFGGFQALMPMLGWSFTHTLITLFAFFQRVVPWIALTLLVLIGGSMLIDSIKPPETARSLQRLSLRLLLAQGIATSVDALSVGFAIADYGIASALLCSAIIAAVTFLICIPGVALGRHVGSRLSSGASRLGGVILIGIGIEILLRQHIL